MDEKLFWDKVHKTDTCWFWIGAKTDGYGAINQKGKNYKAHRVSWELHNGPIAEGMQIDHMCAVRACVNPSHLRVVSQEENLQSKNMTYKVKRRGKGSSKSYLLYIHDPRFRDEPHKSKLINELLERHYGGEEWQTIEKEQVTEDVGSASLTRPKETLREPSSRSTFQRPPIELCKHDMVKGFCKKGC